MSYYVLWLNLYLMSAWKHFLFIRHVLLIFFFFFFFWPLILTKVFTAITKSLHFSLSRDDSLYSWSLVLLRSSPVLPLRLSIFFLVVLEIFFPYVFHSRTTRFTSSSLRRYTWPSHWIFFSLMKHTSDATSISSCSRSPFYFLLLAYFSLSFTGLQITLRILFAEVLNLM